MNSQDLYRAEARQLKALAYLDVLVAHGATAAETAQLPEEGWEAIHQLCRHPYDRRSLASPETRAMVVALLEAREAAQLLHHHGRDPFAAFGGQS